MTAAAPAKRMRNFGSKAVPYLLIAPVVIYYIFFWIRPVLITVVKSFQSAAGAFTFQNYVMVFTDPNFLPALRNTAIIVVFSVTLEFLGALFLALLINRKFFGFSKLTDCRKLGTGQSQNLEETGTTLHCGRIIFTHLEINLAGWKLPDNAGKPSSG